ncbi:hypothetical protein [Lewinella sp. W8]|uniref:hypothetical protein n=1 Tax=Lewinella sp. W8 TaxID=2528208 RepID=UPI001067EE69|nr:hypothetical protein [Lewinella sp. W8]MTB53281.1 hypothetical protein [Lewinella sp. W8]
MRKIHPLLFVLFCLTACPLSAQSDSLLFDADFRFGEGVYFSHAALLSNQPDLPWEAIDGEMVQLPEDYRVQIDGYAYKDERINPELIPYAISLDGLPYLYVRYDKERDFHEFAGLRVRGALSTVRYDTTVTKRQLMKAYNPLNGRPFRQAYVEREKTLTLVKVLHLRSGALKNLDRTNLLPLLSDDPDLSKALREAKEVTEDLLLRAIRLYDDRHPLSLPAQKMNP